MEDPYNMTAAPDASEARPRTTAATAVAIAMLIIEGVGILALAGWELVAILGGDVSSATSGIALLVLAAVFGVAVLAFAFGVLRGQSWARSGGIVTQLLILAVALGAATGAYAEPLVALALAVPAVVTLVLLVLAVRSAARAAREDAGEP